MRARQNVLRLPDAQGYTFRLLLGTDNDNSIPHGIKAYIVAKLLPG